MESTTIIGIASIFIGCINVWTLYAKTKADKAHADYRDATENKFINLGRELATVINKQTEHDTKFVTDQRVRDIVKDEIKPLKDDVAQMTINVAKIMDSLTDLTMELKVTNGIREYEKSRAREMV